MVRREDYNSHIASIISMDTADLYRIGQPADAPYTDGKQYVAVGSSKQKKLLFQVLVALLSPPHE